MSLHAPKLRFTRVADGQYQCDDRVWLLHTHTKNSQVYWRIAERKPRQRVITTYRRDIPGLVLARQVANEDFLWLVGYSEYRPHCRVASKDVEDVLRAIRAEPGETVRADITCAGSRDEARERARCRRFCRGVVRDDGCIQLDGSHREIRP
jgi:hypothetical protein